MGERYPEPGRGLSGAWDRFVGPGTTGVENAGTAAAAILGAAVGFAGDPTA